MFCKVSTCEDWLTTVGEMKANVAYAIPQLVYKNEVFGKVSHTNQGICSMGDAQAPDKPVLPEILRQDEIEHSEPVGKPNRSHHKKNEE